MLRKSMWLCVLMSVCCVLSIYAQQASITNVVPSMVKFTGTLSDADGKPLAGTQGVTFLLYKEQTGGAPLWMETQNVQADKNGHFSVMLGSGSAHGLPVDVFAGGEARWLGVQASGQAGQARTLLVSVPYALKAQDAETLGGKPASAFLAAPLSGAGAGQSGPQTEQKNEIVCSSGTACKSGFVPLFATNGGSAQVNDSIVSQSGSTIKVAGSINTTQNVVSGGDVDATSNVNAVNLNATGGVNAVTVTAQSVSGNNISGGNGTTGVFGEADAGYGVFGYSAKGTAGLFGMLGSGDPTFSYGVYGENDSATGGKGVYGYNKQGAGGIGVQGYAPGTNAAGVAGSSNVFGSIAKSILGHVPVGVIGDSTSGYGVVATSDSSNALIVGNGGGNDTVVISANGGGAPLFAQGTGGSLFLDANGNLSVSGAISAGVKDFKIDHPLDPANKYLYHASVESSEMMNIYTGTAMMDLSGSAVVTLPDWFEAVNGDFRYQLTAIGAPAPNLHIGREISNHQFVIAGGQSGMKVSWQVTGVRHDAFAKAHPLRVSVQKAKGERGYYLHPELYGAPMEKGLAAAHLAQITQHAAQH